MADLFGMNIDPLLEAYDPMRLEVPGTPVVDVPPPSAPVQYPTTYASPNQTGASVTVNLPEIPPIQTPTPQPDAGEQLPPTTPNPDPVLVPNTGGTTPASSSKTWLWWAVAGAAALGVYLIWRKRR